MDESEGDESESSVRSELLAFRMLDGVGRQASGMLSFYTNRDEGFRVRRAEEG